MFCEEGVRIDGACLLGYDDEMQGYYIDRPVTVAEVVRRALAEAGALPGGA